MQIRKVKMSIKVKYWATNRALLSQIHLNAFAVLGEIEIFIIKQKSCGSVKKVSEDVKEFCFVFASKEKKEWKIKDEINPIKSCDIPAISRKRTKRRRKLRRSNKKYFFFLSPVKILRSLKEKINHPRFLSARDRTREVFHWKRSIGNGFRSLTQ